MTWLYTAAGAIVAIVWLARHVVVSRAVGSAGVLTPDRFDGDPNPAPSVSIVVAAKDEEGDIERCVTSLLAQDYPNCQVVAVDDRSTDRTPEILDRLKRAAAERLRVLTMTELPAGWLGKSHAVHTGVQDADGEFFLFTDADCEFTSRRTVATVIRYALENDIEFLSVIPEVRPNCWTELVVQPVCSLVLFFWHHPQRVNDPNRSTAYANGAFMLIRRDAYERIGGHRSVPNVMCEDMQMARNAKAAGVKLHVIRNEGLYFTRMYGSFRETRRGWTRLFTGCFQRPGRVLAALAMLVAFSLSPWLMTLVSAVGFFRTPDDLPSPWMWPLIAWTLAAVAQQAVMLRIYAVMRTATWRAFSYPVGAIFCFAVLLHALLRTAGIGTTSWSGTACSSSHIAPEGPLAKETAHVG